MTEVTRMFPGNVLWFLDNSEFLRALRLFSFGHVGIKMNLILKRPALNFYFFILIQSIVLHITCIVHTIALELVAHRVRLE